MSELVQSVEILNLLAYGSLAAVAVWRWSRRRERTSLWAAVAFGALGAVVIFGRLVSDTPEGTLEVLEQRLLIALLVVFPYFLYRFTTAFDPPSSRLELIVGVPTVALVVWTFALPAVPESGEARSTGFLVFLVAFLLHWTLLSAVAAWRLWRAGRGQPTVSRRRMHLLAAAAGGITLAILLTSFAGDGASVLRLVTQSLAFAAATAFGAGLAPPRILRLAWRRPEEQRVQETLWELMAAEGESEIAERVLPPMAEIVGAGCAALLDREGRLLAAHRLSPELEAALLEGRTGALLPERGELLTLEEDFGWLYVWTSPYAPFFGDEELRLLRTLTSLTGLALDRAALLSTERDARAALERADALKTSFVALAAHELRSPVATLVGMAQTLDERGSELSPETRRELEQTLARQGERLALLVEQLLDLSRLDADAVPIRPERLRVRDRVAEIVASVGGAAGPELSIGPELEASVDPAAFDRIVSNLVANAIRYGQPPVRVTAHQNDRHFRLTVEDHGEGVPQEFVANLFERFTRADGSRATGTGLGLAIARSYAQAHGGDLVYTPLHPHGARFELVVPAKRVEG